MVQTKPQRGFVYDAAMQRPFAPDAQSAGEPGILSGIVKIVSLQMGEYHEKVLENPSLLVHDNIAIIRGL